MLWCVVTVIKRTSAAGSTRSLLSVVVHLLDVNFALLCFAKQVFAEEVGHLPEEVFVLGLETVAVAREILHYRNAVPLRYDFYKGTRRVKLLDSREIRTIRDVCIFEINGMEVYM